MTGIPWQELSVGVAAVVGLVMVAVTMRRVVKDTLSFLGNHLSSVTDAQTKVSAALDKVADRLERVEERIEEHASVGHVGTRVHRTRSPRAKST